MLKRTTCTQRRISAGTSCGLIETPSPALQTALPPALGPCTDPTYYKQWHPMSSYYSQSFDAYFVKVKLPEDGVTYTVEARSYVEAGQHPYFGEEYGVREDCNQSPSESAVCLEIRLPASVNCNNDANNAIQEFETHITVEVTSRYLPVREIATNFRSSTTGFQFPSNNIYHIYLSSTFGFQAENGKYYGHAASRDEAVRLARNRCMNGDDANVDQVNFTNSNNWGIRFDY